MHRFLPPNMLFQSTLPRRERPQHLMQWTSCCYFNPRSREGSDITFRTALTYVEIFQSTLPRRERRNCSGNSGNNRDKFQSTLPRRERLFCRTLFARKRYFNPRSREGSDKFFRCAEKRRFNFNPRSREGSDSKFVQFKQVYLNLADSYCTNPFIHIPYIS